MRGVHVLLLTLGLAGSCAAPRPTKERDPAQVDRLHAGQNAGVARPLDSGSNSSDRAELLDGLRAQLESSVPDVVAWAAWRIAEERIEGLNFELRRAAVAWGRKERDSGAVSVTKACLLDALIQNDVHIAADEFEPWTSEVEHRGALLVLASRSSTCPVKYLLHLFDEGAHGDNGEVGCEVAGHLLVESHLPSAIEGLLERCRFYVELAVIDRDAKSVQAQARGMWGSGMPSYPGGHGLPPFLCYSWARGQVSETTRSAGLLGDFRWKREQLVAGRGRCVAFVDMGFSRGRRAHELLRAVAGMEPRSVDTRVRCFDPVPWSDLGSLRTVVDERVRRAENEWSDLLLRLRERGLTGEAASTDRRASIEFNVRDERTTTEAPLPLFVR